MKKTLPIGIEDYKELIEKSYYYVDKTMMVKELLDRGGKVNLFTRPRRFGKTLTLSMLKTWFEKEMDADGTVIDNSRYFEGTEIMETGENYTRHMGQYPVISMSLKSAKQPDFETAYKCLREQIAEEFKRHAYILNSDSVIESDKEKYRAIMEERGEKSAYATCLAFLSRCLKRYHKKNVIVLLDEYDVPLENAFFSGFYDQMIAFIRSLFESVLKTNDSLEFAVITGCLRISKESIFTGLNNLNVISILNNSYAEYFGFTPLEVRKLLEFYGLEEKEEEVTQWYDGYLFGKTEVYNPWSVIAYADTAISNPGAFARPYWSNTSSNDIVRKLVARADSATKQEIEELIAGGTIEKPIHEDITYEDVYKTQDNLWNFLFFTGYLKAVSQRFEINTIYLTMKIPNEEVKYIYQNTIREWFEQEIKTVDFTEMYQALFQGEAEQLQENLKQQLRKSISYYDNGEMFYHGFMMGMLGSISGYYVKSNRESGNGRPDILLIPLDEQQPAVIMEIKHAKKFPQMEELCEEALKQIEEQDYAEELLEEGYENILKYGICFCKKSCKVKCGE